MQRFKKRQLPAVRRGYRMGVLLAMAVSFVLAVTAGAVITPQMAVAAERIHKGSKSLNFRGHASPAARKSQTGAGRSGERHTIPTPDGTIIDIILLKKHRSDHGQTGLKQRSRCCPEP